MTRSIVVTLWVLLAGQAFAQIQSGLDYDVYFLAGQSNATGRGIASELPGISGGIYNDPQTDVAFYYSSTLTNSSGQINTALQEDVFLPLQAGSGHGFNNPSSAPVEFGPELSLGRTLADEYPSRNIAIIKYGHGGSNLHTQWDVRGIRYTHFVETANSALNAITGAGATFNLKGLSWVQGESDANSNSTAYEANLTDFISRVRNDVFAGEDAPIVVSRLSANQYNSLSTNINNVRNAQSAVALADPNVFTIDTDGPEFSTYNISTPIHFDAMGNIAQGIAIAQAFVDGQQPLQPPSGSTIYTINDATRFGDNGANAGGNTPSLTSNLDGTFTLANDPSSGINNSIYIESGPQNIAGLLQRPLEATDTVVVTGTIDSSTINPHANGFEFGLQSATGFRSDPNLMWKIDDNGARGKLAPFFGTSGSPNGLNPQTPLAPGASEASLVDGFSFSATYDETGITYTVTDIVTENEIAFEPGGAASYTYFWPGDADYAMNFTTLVGDSFAYFSAQGNAPSETIISEFQIDVLAAGLLCDLDADGDCDPSDIDLLYQTDSPDIATWLEQAANTSNPWKTDLARNPGGSAPDIYVNGDINLDGDVNSTDLGLLLNNFGNSDGLPPNGVGWSGGDLDANGDVNSSDLGLLLNNFSFSSANFAVVPEPSSFVLWLAFAVIGLHFRRK